MLVDIVRTIKTEIWCVVVILVVMVAVKVSGLNGDHVCMMQQKYNITKRIKYRAPMSIRTYEWCFSMPPRCSKWSTEMRDLTRLETEERIAEVAVCCPGYKMRDTSCVPICPSGKTGSGCSEDCPKNKWGPNCVYECKSCSEHGACLAVTGECQCRDGRQGERCELSMSTPPTVEELTTTKPVTMPTSSIDSKSTTSTARTSPNTTVMIPITSAKAVPTSTSVILTSISSSTVPTSTVVSTTSTSSVPTATSIPTTSTRFTSINSSMKTTTTTLMTTAEKNLQSAKIATSGAEKVNLVPYETTLLFNLSNYTSTTPWSLSTNKSIATTHQPLITTNDASKFKKLTTTEAVIITTAPTTVVTVTNTVPTTQPPTEAIIRTETSTVTVKTTKESLVSDLTFKEATRKTETTHKTYPTTIKFKPKEIWIRPAQKGELLVETKVKPNLELLKYKSATQKEITINTTPRTIMVSIIPTSLSYATFRKIALTTTTYFPFKNLTGKNSTEAFTRSISSSTPLPVKKPSTKPTIKSFQSVTIYKTHTPPKPANETKPSTETNSMSTNANKPNSSDLPTISSAINSTLRPWTYYKPPTKPITTLTSKPTMKPMGTTENFIKNQFMTVNRYSATTKIDSVTAIPKINVAIGKTNDTKNITPRPSTNVTEAPEGEETFDILTEPEHITAVMGEKGAERSSVDLISVISIAGGVMMTVITVAVVIVMLERCKRPRYEDRKMNNIRMQVMIDNNDGPPPYVRSIFNTPLPEPPSTDKCHYQPISTLDRNLKQFMRPVVVQTISPMMLENFRGILECHYDHLPRRSMEFQTLQSRRSLAPSLSGFDELRQPRPNSLAESTIEALKCEAKLDVIDNTTSEPLYAEIPCWRPPSAHAIEVVNLNGEAVTEL